MKRIDELKENDIFSFQDLPDVQFYFIQFKWRSDILICNPVGTNRLFETDAQCNELVLIP